MIDEEKQQDNTSPQTQSTLSQENEGEQSPATEVEASVAKDLELPSDLDQPITQESTDSQESAPEEILEVKDAPSATEAPAVEVVLEDTETLKQEIEALKAQLEQQNLQLDSLKSQSARIAADFDNFRKRTSKEKEELELQVKRSTISELLPVVDNFERARAQIKPQNDGEMAIHKSYQGVYKQLVDCLKRIGVAPMRPEGQEFDPNLHEAVMREATDEYQEGVVIEQLQRGYFLGERVLRHAMVKVAAAVEPVVTSEEGTPEIADN
ncbi:MAG: nucleotide exchange factor GrpE [Symploca sp. SIO3C6]|uniref:Protein GrpE n=1 Tax=Symploca sp. SIO1C4 TaxID=2607765 RepID=A0A6B3NH85_9CYAN|nr:nucleotide exchange factor GrpE [Symploca sp. SIO3C6]NER28668.1 nucleotide exchange factor GrpE [Symploca sp. SIO1C4]NET06957.1 nucleotide exchange factor GrpE [Symploca sp. SIO2B6]